MGQERLLLFWTRKAAGQTTKATKTFLSGVGKNEEHYLGVINFSDRISQANVKTLWNELRKKVWQLNDSLLNKSYDRIGSDMRDTGLYIDLGPWQFHFFQIIAI